jgi:hypothetical protein
MEKKEKIIFVLLDDVLITTLSGNKWPTGIWDYKIIWPFWNALKNYKANRIAILSNQYGIGRGYIKDSSFWAKIRFIASGLSDFLGTVKITTRYSIQGNWTMEGEDMVDSVLGRIGKKREDLGILFIGRTGNYYDQAYAGKHGIEYTDNQNFIQEYGKQPVL